MKNSIIKKGASLVDNNIIDIYNLMEDFFDDKWFVKPIKLEMVKVDIEEKDNEYLVEAELPGFAKEEIKVELVDEALTIRAKHEESKETNEKNYLHQERSSNEMIRTIYLNDAKADGIKAKLDNGLLKLQVPKIKQLKPVSKINIE
jgi:HSP20 family protein